MTGEGWALLDRVLGWVREAGLLAIVDLHAADVFLRHGPVALVVLTDSRDEGFARCAEWLRLVRARVDLGDCEDRTVGRDPGGGQVAFAREGALAKNGGEGDGESLHAGHIALEALRRRCGGAQGQAMFVSAQTWRGRPA